MGVDPPVNVPVSRSPLNVTLNFSTVQKILYEFKITRNRKFTLVILFKIKNE